MAFTKIAAAGIGSTETVTLHSLEVLNNATVGGVLTYEDVTNVDSIGIITARSGVLVGSGITLSTDGNIFATGIATVGFLTVTGNNMTVGSNKSIFAENNVRFKSAGDAFIDHNTTGQDINFRVSNSSSLDTTPLVVKTTGINVTGSGTFTGDVDIADKIVHTGDTNTAIRFPSADVISFENGGTETARASATNQFSVGTTADIAGVSVSIGGSVRLVNANDRTATISALPSGTYNTGHSGGSAIAFHRVSDGGGGSDEIAFETHHQGNSHSESLRIEKAGDIKVNRGDLYFGTAGKGIVLGATSNTDANTLDDYEEGTFTPTAAEGGSVSSYVVQRGSYTKTGDYVICQIDLSVNGTASGDAFRVGGLPFTSANQATYAFGGAFLSYSNGAFPSGSNNRALFHVLSGSTVIGAYQEAGSPLAGNSTGMNVYGSKEFLMVVTYKVA